MKRPSITSHTLMCPAASADAIRRDSPSLNRTHVIADPSTPARCEMMGRTRETSMSYTYTYELRDPTAKTRGRKGDHAAA